MVIPPLKAGDLDGQAVVALHHLQTVTIDWRVRLTRRLLESSE